MIDLKEYLKTYQGAINNKILELLKEADNSSRVVQAMQYSISAGGKRIRPILAMAAAEATHAQASDVLPAACAIEMIHTYSLIHDDLPAMDDDTLRRGRPTSHIQYDEATAILAGDALLTLAFDILSSTENTSRDTLSRHLKIINVLARAAGYQGMIQGQMQDIRAEFNELDLDALIAMHSLKTGALIEASVVVGALFGRAGREKMHSLRSYARHIGLAFQVIDDILNVSGDPAKLGKAVGTDMDRGKNTFPGLMGLTKATAYAENLVQTALKALAFFDNKADPLRAIAQYIIDRNN
ncbi:polyprenyl synthetase family protein [Thermodesulfobacteriota bacterium]